MPIIDKNHLPILETDDLLALQTLLQQKNGIQTSELIFDATSFHAPKCLTYLLENQDGSPIFEDLLILSLPCKLSEVEESNQEYLAEQNIMKILIEKGKFSQNQLEQCLIHATHTKEKEIAKLLIEAGARPEIQAVGHLYRAIFQKTDLEAQCKNFDPTCPLAEFLLAPLCENNAACAEILLNNGVIPKGEYGEHAVRCALRNRNKPLFELLRKKGAPTDILPEELAAIAAQDHQPDALRINLALCRNPQITATNILRTHAGEITKEICQYLLLEGADPNPKMGNPVTKAAKAGNLEVIQLLLENGGTPKVLDAFRDACMNNQLPAVQLLHKICPLPKENLTELIKFLEFVPTKGNEATFWFKTHAI